MRRRWRSRARRTAGFPPSGNGASSFHLGWQLPTAAGHLVSVAVTLEVVTPPVVDHLCFWALQVSFPGEGAAHLGLQWNRRHPGFGAVNWGGYGPRGALLGGTASPLPSTPADPNTRDYPWQAGREYRLAVSRGGPGTWRGEVSDLSTGSTTLVRELFADSPYVAAPMVWSEIFARCDDPSVTVRWSAFEVTSERGESHRPTALDVNYQSHPAGGCSNTASILDPSGDGVLQVTTTERATPQGARLALISHPRSG